jgi:NAD(P)H-dependent FMN reductase
MAPLTVSLVYGSVRTERQGIRAVRFLQTRLQQREVRVHLIDPMKHPLPLLDRMYKEYEPGQAPQAMQHIAQCFAGSDGFCIVTGEYNHSIPPALKNVLDHFQQEYLFKPCAIACYSAGRYGGMRAAVHMRALVSELGMPSISSIKPFPKVQDSLGTDGTPRSDVHEKSTTRFLDEFIWYMEALRDKRHQGVPF